MGSESIKRLRKQGFSLRDAKYAVTKQEILIKYIELILMEEKIDVSIESIYIAVGISKATFFNYFNRREDIFLYQIQIWFYEIFCSYKELIDMEAEQLVMIIFKMLADRIAKERVYLRAFVQVSDRFVLESHQLEPLTEVEVMLLNMKYYSENQPILSFGGMLEEIHQKAIKNNRTLGRINLGRLFESLHVIFVGGASYADANRNISLNEVYQNQLNYFFSYYRN